MFIVQEIKAPLFTKEGLYTSIEQRVRPPESLTLKEFQALPENEREDYDRKRLLYMNTGMTVNTPQMMKAVKLTMMTVAGNAGVTSGRRGVALSGQSTIGKTTTAKAIIHRFESRYRRTFPDYREHNKLPVVFVSVPPAPTPKTLAREFATFLGWSNGNARLTLDELTNMVVANLHSAGTQLVVVDEIHNLINLSYGHSEASDFLKHLSNLIPATFVYAGINLRNNGLLNGQRGAQIEGRFSILDLEPFTLANSEAKTTWQSVIQSFEDELRLISHPAGSLVKLSDYLFQRTKGSIGSLSHLLRFAAMSAIGDREDNNGKERITKQLLDDVLLDAVAEAPSIQHKQVRMNSANRRKKAA